MNSKVKHFNDFKAYSKYVGNPPPEHPMLSIISLDEISNHSLKTPESISTDFYIIVFKKIHSGYFHYGRTNYDFNNGSIFFIKPRQVIQWSKIEHEQEGFVICFHEDYIKNTALFDLIESFNFFSYAINEALHLSPKEEIQLQSIFQILKTEYHNNQDKLSKEIIISQLITFLKFTQRYYERQFINRKEISGLTIDKFNNWLHQYFNSPKIEEKGIPNIEIIAKEFGFSQRYLSDTIKNETGKTPIEHFHLFLMNKAKDLLLQPETSISEVAYKLGFEYPQYFSRLFKKKLGVTPSEFIEMNHF